MMKRKYLIVHSSSSQMNSGLGRTTFDWVYFAKSFFEFTLLIDTNSMKNAQAAKQQCDKLGVECILCEPLYDVTCCDAIPSKIPSTVAREKWDVVECYGWASAGTNKYILDCIDDETLLIYTPVAQSLLTIPDERFHDNILQSMKKMLRRANIVPIVCTHEIEHLHHFAEDKSIFCCFPLGVNGKFCFKQTHLVKRVISLFDICEPRKRSDLHFAAIGKALEKENFQFEIGGSATAKDLVPPTLYGQITVLPYISDEELVKKYQSSSALLLISDYECFGYPIAEALCCGCPVIINTQFELIDIYAGLPGVYFVKNTDTQHVAATIAKVLRTEHDRQHIASEAQKAFCFSNTFSMKLERIFKYFDCVPYCAAGGIAVGQRLPAYPPSDKVSSYESMSFSQDGIDRIIFFYLSSLDVNYSDLRYLDIGAATPVAHNNTFLFNRLGAKGVLVEADPKYFAEYSLHRSEDMAIHAAVLPVVEEGQTDITFYRYVNPDHSTVISHGLGDDSKIEDSFRVPALSIYNICANYYPYAKIDILSIDIEGCDEQVIFNFPFELYDPMFIVYEKGNVPHDSIFTSKITIFLESKGYCLAASTFMNIMYAKRHILKNVYFL